MNKKGFTLVEVLAVIILLGLIAAILIPNYNKTIEKSKKNSFKESLNGLVRTIENNGRYCGSGKKNEFTIIKGECP